MPFVAPLVVPPMLKPPIHGPLLMNGFFAALLRYVQEKPHREQHYKRE